MFFLNKSFKFLFTFAICFLFFNTLSAESELERDLGKLRQEVEKMELKYWRLKDGNLKKKRAISEKIDFFDQSLKATYARRNSLTEETFLALENLEKIKSGYESIKDDRESFKSTMLEVADKDVKKLKGSHPRLIEDGIRRLSFISDGSVDSSLELLARGIVDYKLFLLGSAEEVETYVGKVVNEETKSSVRATFLRLGFIHSSYLAEDGGVGLLLRTSDLTGVYYSWFSKLPDDESNDIKLAISSLSDNDNLPFQLNVPVDVAQVGSRTRSLLEGSSSNLVAAWVVFFKAGGVLMYPLALLAFFSFLIAIERIIFFWQGSGDKAFEMGGFMKALSEKDYEKAKTMLSFSGKYCFEALNPLFFMNQPKLVTMEKQVESGLQNVSPKLEARLSTLAVLGSIAPLLGLLGTVSGMINLFDVITVYGTSNPKILAGGISIALITTQVGLSIAIPILLCHHFLKQRKNKIFEKIEQLGLLIIEHKINVK